MRHNVSTCTSIALRWKDCNFPCNTSLPSSFAQRERKETGEIKCREIKDCQFYLRNVLHSSKASEYCQKRSHLWIFFKSEISKLPSTINPKESRTIIHNNYTSTANKWTRHLSKLSNKMWSSFCSRNTTRAWKWA